MSLDLEQLAEQTAVQVAGAAIGKALDKFTESQPAVADKVALGKDLLERAIAMIPDEELHAYLTSDAEAAALVAFRVAKAAKLAR